MASLKTIHPELMPYAQYIYDVARLSGLAPNITSVYRDSAQQAGLYRDWIAGRSRFPAAPPGNSMHEKRLAFDMTVNDFSFLTDLGQIWKGFGPNFRWGGDFKKPRPDPIHFDYKP